MCLLSNIPWSVQVAVQLPNATHQRPTKRVALEEVRLHELVMRLLLDLISMLYSEEEDVTTIVFPNGSCMMNSREPQG